MSELFSFNGYCPSYNTEVTIAITYFHVKALGMSGYKKMTNYCPNRENCSYFEKCPVFEEAPNSIED